MDYAESLIGKYVILKPEYWNQEIETGFLDSYGNPKLLKMTDTNYSNVGGLVKEVPRIGYVFANNGDGTIVVQTGFFMPRRGRDFETVNANMLTTFRVELYPDARIRNGSLGDPNEQQVGRVIGNIEEYSDLEESVFLVKNNQTGETSWYDTNEFDLKVIPDESMDRARNVSSMLQTSRRGVLEHLPIVSNTRGIIMEYLTGLRLRNPNGMTFEKPYQTEFREQVLGRTPRTVFNNGPLPHGPTEKNFLGGKRFQRTKAIRKTRKQTKSRRQQGKKGSK